MSSNESSDSNPIYFHHSCLHSKQIGDIIATKSSLVWIPNDKTIPKYESTWSNISKVKYSKDGDARAALNISQIVPHPSIKDTVFVITGKNSVEKNRMELEKLKVIISSIKKDDFNSLEIISIPNKNDDSFQPINSSTSSTILNKINIDQQTKVKLLESDDFLLKQYLDLVETTHLLNENEFWETYGPDKLKQIDMLSTVQQQATGKLLSQLSESITIKLDDCSNISNEKKKDIFKVYPAVKIAFNDIDSLGISEEDFWRRYSISFGPNSEGIDDLFLRHMIDDNNNIPEIKINLKYKTLSNQIDSSVNLIDIDDRIINNSNSNQYSLRTENDEKVRDEIRIITGGWNQFNRQSKIILDSNASTILPGSKRKRVNLNQTDDLHELLDLQTNPLLPSISINRDSRNKIIHNNDIETIENDVNMDIDNVFGVSSNLVVRSLRKTSIILQNSEELLSSINRSIPTIEKSEIFYHNNKNSLNIQSQFNELNDFEQYSEIFKQEMSEIYINITERMKYFYSILSRQGNQAPINGSISEKKIIEIIHNLNIISDKLSTRKHHIQQKVTAGKLFLSDACYLV